MTKKINNISMFIGRLNPMTVYHRDIIKYHNIQVVFITPTEDDNKNPIHPNPKKCMTEHALGEGHVVLVANGLGAALKEIVVQFAPDCVTLHCGTDRAVDYQRLNTYNKDIGFKELVIVTHDRLDETHSATHLRWLARMGQKNEFMKLCGYTHEFKEKAYDMIRHKYGCV